MNNINNNFNTDKILGVQKNMIDFWSSQVSHIFDMAQNQQITMIEQQLSKAVEKGKITKESAESIRRIYSDIYKLNKEINKISSEHIYSLIQETLNIDKNTLQRLIEVSNTYNSQLALQLEQLGSNLVAKSKK